MAPRRPCQRNECQPGKVRIHFDKLREAVVEKAAKEANAIYEDAYKEAEWIKQQARKEAAGGDGVTTGGEGQ